MSPSPGNRADLILPTCSMSKATEDWNAATQPMSALRISPSCRVRSWMAPPACRKTHPSPFRRCMMKPSSPKKPALSRLMKAMPTLAPWVAHRNESFWAISSPPSWPRWTGTTLPG